ncbi:hypothetical protein Anas_09109 [Armadillidium nasatum]|uniref:Cuticle protein n=1 Tax=Armadillidium nasatum TaxID=96803 RepID=A0A5N5SWF3_9CRUS|nr:hypothetical protein Anas_09109 [Armadillidium nasatum]
MKRMSHIVALCLVAVAFGLPQNFREVERREPIKILRSEVSPIDGANFSNFIFLFFPKILFRNRKWNSNTKGRNHRVTGTVQYGWIFHFPLDDGTIGEVRYIADENGYQPESALIPTPHPLPAHALEQIRFAEEQRARGVEWDIRGFQI